MKKKLQGNLILIVLLMSFFCAVGEHSIYDQAKLSRLTEKTITSSGFRQMELNDDMITILRERRGGENDMGKRSGKKRSLLWQKNGKKETVSPDI